MNVEETLPVPAQRRNRMLASLILREALSWLWVILAFLFITGTIVQARVIPSGSMEKTLLVGDHLLMSRFGYDAERAHDAASHAPVARTASPADDRLPRAASRARRITSSA